VAVIFMRTRRQVAGDAWFARILSPPEALESRGNASLRLCAGSLVIVHVSL